MPKGESAAQLRREAQKARQFATQAVTDIETNVLNGIADTLEKEAAAIELALATTRRVVQSA